MKGHYVNFAHTRAQQQRLVLPLTGLSRDELRVVER
jgi:hypothetical protein